MESIIVLLCHFTSALFSFVAVALACGAAAAQAQANPPYASVDIAGLAQAARPINNNYPVAGVAQVFVSNRWGNVQIIPWHEQIVRITGEIRVGAATTEIAERLAQAVEISGNHVGDRIEIQTKYPAVELPTQFGFETDIEVNVPATAAVEVANTFGDVVVHGIKGALTMDTLFLRCGLGQSFGSGKDAYARSRIQTRSKEPACRRSFYSAVSGNEFQGRRRKSRCGQLPAAVTLRPGLRPSKINVVCTSGPIHLVLDPGAKPDLVALADGGAVRSNMTYASETWGNTTTVRSKNADAAQHIDLLAL